MNPFNRSVSFQPYRLACLLLVLLAGMFVVAQSQTGLEISGTVLDPSGEALAEAKIILRQSANSTEQTKNTDPKGRFRFTRLAGGEYEIEVQKDGFKPIVTKIRVGATPAAPLRIVLPLAEVREEVAVAAQPDQVSANPDENLNVVKLNQADLKICQRWAMTCLVDWPVCWMLARWVPAARPSGRHPAKQFAGAGRGDCGPALVKRV